VGECGIFQHDPGSETPGSETSGRASQQPLRLAPEESTVFPAKRLLATERWRKAIQMSPPSTRFFHVGNMLLYEHRLELDFLMEIFVAWVLVEADLSWCGASGSGVSRDDVPTD